MYRPYINPLLAIRAVAAQSPLAYASKCHDHLDHYYMPGILYDTNVPHRELAEERLTHETRPSRPRSLHDIASNENLQTRKTKDRLIISFAAHLS